MRAGKEPAVPLSARRRRGSKARPKRGSKRGSRRSLVGPNEAGSKHKQKESSTDGANKAGAHGLRALIIAAKRPFLTKMLILSVATRAPRCWSTPHGEMRRAPGSLPSGARSAWRRYVCLGLGFAPDKMALW